ncbi:hypothetical protein HG535_0H00820 [Zygotorulaspora mrakii]|uniref:Uncharacterized protein n=1 Tax=Zygotorulaspora mrakii TaxID=42260 RepID=A0A7H9B8R3_ZYGMR|nr:uncharacterized protein HG535_0H00820 [Zygotorulaspora mrakii]QLG74756.1 hypothetical protein HG535_0H00820 [Zygotorulaspora mrakii]
MATEDQISRLKRAIFTTTATLFGSQNVEDTILSYSSPYKRALHQAISSLGSQGSLNSFRGVKKNPQEAFQSLNASMNGKNFFNNKFTDSKTSFKVLSYISDDLLNEIENENYAFMDKKLLKNGGEKGGKSKSSKQEPSLFQGFEASLPIINEALENKMMIESSQSNLKGISHNPHENDNDENFDINESILLPHDFHPEKINDSYSLKYLKTLNSQVTDNLDLLEIQKKIAASEIGELDHRLNALKSLRDSTFKKVAKIEQNELVLENHLNMINERVSFLKEYGLEIDSGADSDMPSTPMSPQINTDKNDESKSEPMISDSNDNSDETNGIQSVFSVNDSDFTSPMMSQSIYKKLKIKNQTPSKKLHDFYHDYNKKSRKIFPTLQQYYNPGTRMARFEKAHEDGITCLDFDVPFGILSTAGHMDHCVKIWDLSQHKKIAEMSGHMASISCMQMDRRYNMLITGARDALLKMWNLNLATQLYQEQADLKPSSESSCVYTFDSHVDEITALSFDSGHLVSGSQDRTIRQWDMTSGKCLQTIDISFAGRVSQSHSLNNTTMLTSIDPSPIIGALQCFDAALASGTKDGIVRLWDLRSSQIIRTLEGHTDAVTSLKFDSRNLVTGSLDRSVRVWDLRTGTLADAFAYDSPVLSLDFDTHNIVVATGEKSAKVFDRSDGKQWDCVEKEDQDASSNSDLNSSNIPETIMAPASTSSTVQFLKYKDGYMVEGRDNGDVSTWAI